MIVYFIRHHDTLIILPHIIHERNERPRDPEIHERVDVRPTSIVYRVLYEQTVTNTRTNGRDTLKYGSHGVRQLSPSSVNFVVEVFIQIG